MLINSQISSDKLMSVVHVRDYLSLVRNKGWYVAFYELQKRMPAKAGQIFSNMLNARREAWKYLLPMSRSAKVLCLGWGWSSVPLAMARSCKNVVVLEGVKESLESLRALADSEGLNNILYVNAVDSSALPLLDSCFDIVVINGVLDCVLSQDRDNARALQLKFLSEVLRVLGPCGVIYLGIGNRLSYAHLQEGLRERMTLFRAFTNGDVLSRRDAPCRTWTYSLSGYRRLLKEAGLRSVHFYSPLPDHLRPKQMVDLDDTSRMGTEAVIGSRWKVRLKSNIGLLRRYSPSFSIIMSKQEKLLPSFLDCLICELEQRIGISSITCTRYDVRSWGIILFCTVAGKRKTDYVARLPFREGGALRVQENARSLRILKDVDWKAGIGQVRFPELIYEGTIENQRVSVETCVPGQVPKKLVNQHSREVMVLEVCRFLIQLGKLTMSDYGALKPQFEACMSSMCEDVKRALIDEEQKKLFGSLSELVLEKLSRVQTPFVWVHGDFKLDNCLWDLDREVLSGVVDWDQMMTMGLPGWDLLNLFISMRRRVGPGKGDSLIELLEGPWQVYEEQMWSVYAAEFSLSAELRPILLLSVWIKGVWSGLHFGHRRNLNHAWINSTVRPVLDAFARGEMPQRFFG